MENKKTIELKNINKSFGNHKVLNNINLTVYENDIIGLVGPNGAGKSTLIRIISELLIEDSGEKIIDYTQTKIGVLLEGSRNIYTFLTVEENIKYFSILNKIDESRLNERMDELLEYFDLKYKKYEKAENLSRGMIQKLSILILLLKEPDVLILDEPTLGLDLVGTINMKNFLSNLTKEYNKTIIICSHDIDVITEICERIVILKKGEILIDDSLSNIRLKKEDEYIVYYYENDKNHIEGSKKINNDVYALEGKSIDELINITENRKIIKIENISTSLENVLKEIY